MATIWFFSDPHFAQESIIHFKRWDGQPMRPYRNAQEMDEALIANCNERVKPQDHLYILGDISMKRWAIAKVGRINGHKRLITGNHDIHKTKDYLPFFEEIRGIRVFDNLLLTHIPVHPANLPNVGAKKTWVNVHGHIHANMSPEAYFTVYGPRYLNISCEMTDFFPIDLSELRRRIVVHQEAYTTWKEENDVRETPAL